MELSTEGIVELFTKEIMELSTDLIGVDAVANELVK